MTVPDRLYVRSGGTGGPLLLLLHGMGATGGVWQPLLDVALRQWPYRWAAPDLPGHGRSPALTRYSYGAVAAHVAEAAGGADGDGDVVVVGHSFGGVVGLALASGWFGLPVSYVVALGVKVSWSPDELAAMQRLGGREERWFDDERDARERYLKLAGLAGLVAADSPLAGDGVVSDGGRHRAAWHGGAALVGAPPMRSLIAAIDPDRFVVARGEHDHMVSDRDVTSLGVRPATLPGVGHNAHVENPGAVWDFVRRRLDGAATS